MSDYFFDRASHVFVGPALIRMADDQPADTGNGSFHVVRLQDNRSI